MTAANIWWCGRQVEKDVGRESRGRRLNKPLFSPIQHQSPLDRVFGSDNITPVNMWQHTSLHCMFCINTIAGIKTFSSNRCEQCVISSVQMIWVYPCITLVSSVKMAAPTTPGPSCFLQSFREDWQQLSCRFDYGELLTFITRHGGLHKCFRPLSTQFCSCPTNFMQCQCWSLESSCTCHPCHCLCSQELRLSILLIFFRTKADRLILLSSHDVTELQKVLFLFRCEQHLTGHPSWLPCRYVCLCILSQLP